MFLTNWFTTATTPLPAHVQEFEMKKLFFGFANKKAKVKINAQEQLGKGAYGQVLAAELILENETINCAAKMMPKEQGNEAQVLIAMLEKVLLDEFPKNIVTVYGVAEDKLNDFIVMERMETNLHELLYNKPELSSSWTLHEREAIMAKCFNAVVEMHALGMVHRDIKSTNFLTNRDASIVKLADLGSVKRSSTTTVQGLGNIYGGTVAYMAPERLAAKDDEKLSMAQWMSSDLYSVGIVMCEVFTGKEPWGSLYREPKLYNFRIADLTIAPFNTTQISGNAMRFILEAFLRNNTDNRLSEGLFRGHLLDNVTNCFSTAMNILYSNTDNDKSIAIELLDGASYSCGFCAAVLCYFYRMGKFVEQNEAKAEHYERETQKGKKYLQSVLQIIEDLFVEVAAIVRGMAYQFGWCYEQHFTRAENILSQFNQNSVALYQLGVLYLDDNFPKKNKQKAIHFFESSANLNNGAAMCMLGKLLVKLNNKQAMDWYERANAIGCDNIVFHGTGDVLASLLTPLYKHVMLSSVTMSSLSCLTSCGNLKSLDLSSCGIGDDGCKMLSNALSKTVQSLILHNNGIGDAGCASLSAMLKECKVLQTLILSVNKICDAGCSLLSNSLKECTQLRTILLSNNKFYESGCSTLCDALLCSQHLQVLYLSGNKIGDLGCQALSKLLCKCKYIQVLGLRDCNIRDAGCIAICNALESNCNKLISLDFSTNKIGNSACPSLCQALNASFRIQSLDLFKNDIGDAGSTQLGIALRCCNQLHTIDMSFNTMSDSAYVELCNHLKECKTLSTARLGSEKMTVATKKHIKSALLFCKTVKEENILRLSIFLFLQESLSLIQQSWHLQPWFASKMKGPFFARL